MGGNSLSADNDELVQQFRHYLWLERGLSENTLASYTSDISLFARWLADQGDSLRRCANEQVLAYLADRVKTGASSRTTARLLSALKRFYRYLVREKLIQADPTALVEAPKAGRPLPQSLTEQQIERLLQAPDTSSNEGMRDRAMIELTYSSGLRVSELVAMRLGQLDLHNGTLRVTGKGGKERLTPVGDYARESVLRRGTSRPAGGPG